MNPVILYQKAIMSKIELDLEVKGALCSFWGRNV